MKSTCLHLTILLLLCAVSGSARDRVFVRITPLETNPSGKPIYCGVITYLNAHQVIDKFAFGKPAVKRPFSTGFHDYLDWKELQDLPALAGGTASAWFDISPVVYYRRPFQEGWTPYSNRYAPKTLVFSFYSPELPMRPGGNAKTLESGNFNSVTARVEFATEPSSEAVVKTVSYTSGNSCVPLHIPQPLNHLASYADSIVTLYDDAQARLSAVKARGVLPAPLPKRIITSVRIKNGYFYPVLDRETMLLEAELAKLLGIRSIQWMCTQPIMPDVTVRDFPGQELVFSEHGTPYYVAENPWTVNFRQKVEEHFGKKFKKIRTDWELQPEQPLLFKAGDEWRLIKTETIQEAPKGTMAFQQWLADKGVKPDAIGVDTLDHALPILRSGIKCETDDYLFFLTSLFRQETTVAWWQSFKDGLRAADRNLLCTTETVFGRFDDTPDFFLLSRAGVTDVDAHEYAQRLWEPAHAAIYKANTLRSAAKFGVSRPGILWCSHRGLSRSGDAGPVGIVELDGTTALINRMQQFYVYSYGPGYFGGISTTEHADVLTGIAKILHRAAKLEEYLLDGSSSRDDPPAAVLLSKSSELWHPNGLDCERRMLCAALAWNQIPFDLISELDVPQVLKNYRVLYTVAPNVETTAGESILQWLKNGGILFSTAGSCLFNEKNKASHFLELASANSLKLEAEKDMSIRSNYGETQNLYKTPTSFGEMVWQPQSKGTAVEVVTLKEVYVDFEGKILGRYENGKTAALELDVGKGKLIRIGTCLGTALARTMKPVFRRVEIDDFRSLDKEVCQIYRYPFDRHRNLQRPLIVDKPAVDAAFFEKKDGTGAVVLLADYESEEEEILDIKAKFRFKYRHCRAEDGKELVVQQLEDSVRIKDVPLGISQVVELTP